MAIFADGDCFAITNPERKEIESKRFSRCNRKSYTSPMFMIKINSFSANYVAKKKKKKEVNFACDTIMVPRTVLQSQVHINLPFISPDWCYVVSSTIFKM